MSWPTRTSPIDIREGGRRARISKTDQGWLAEVGGQHVEVTVLDRREQNGRAPEIDGLSRMAGAVMPWVARCMPPLPGSSKEVVQTYIEAFKNQQRFGVFPRAFAPKFRHHFDYDVRANHWASWVATGRGFLNGFPDVQVEIIDLLAQGPWVVEHNVARGTHLGRFRGVEPTHRRVRWSEVHVYRIEDSCIVENWPCVDFGSILGQLRAEVA